MMGSPRRTPCLQRGGRARAGPGFAIEAAYVGRRGRDLLIRRDLAMPMDIVDPKSGVNYFTAAQQLITAYRQGGVDELDAGQLPRDRTNPVLGEHVPRCCRRRDRWGG